MSPTELLLTTKEETDTCRSLQIHYHEHSAEENKVLKRKAGQKGLCVLSTELGERQHVPWKYEYWLLTAAEKWVRSEPPLQSLGRRKYRGAHPQVLLGL